MDPAEGAGGWGSWGEQEGDEVLQECPRGPRGCAWLCGTHPHSLWGQVEAGEVSFKKKVRSKRGKSSLHKGQRGALNRAALPPLIAHQCLQTPQPQPCLRHLLPGHPTLGEVAGQCCLCPSESIQRSVVTQPRAEESHPQQLAAATQHMSQTLEYNPTKQELQCKCRQRNLQRVKPTVSHCPAAWDAACHSCTFAASYQPWRSAVLSGAEGCGRTQTASSLHIPLWGDTQTSTGCEGNPNSCNEMLRLQKPVGWGCFHGLPLCSTSEQSAIRKTSEVDFRKQTRQRKRRHMNQRAAFHSESHQAPKQNAILLHGSCL